MKNSIDETDIINNFYENNIVANLYSTINRCSDRSGIVYENKCFIYVDNINNPYEIKVFDNERSMVSDKVFDEEINGYEHDFLNIMMQLWKKYGTKIYAS